MDYEKIEAFAAKYGCSESTAALYYDLRAEGMAPEAALIWCGLA